MFENYHPCFLLFAIIIPEAMSLFIFKYFKAPSINASSINICEKKPKQQQKRMGQDRAERIVDEKVCKKGE